MTVEHSSCDSQNVSTFKGKDFLNKNYKKTPNVIVFDLDETLGSYSDLYILWCALKDIIEFNVLLDIYPEFLRCGILPILEYIYQKKRGGICNKVFIYTNNQCADNFVELISNYFSYKINASPPLFDQIIRAFKSGNKIIEAFRTTHKKTPEDFIRCTLLPKTTKICFIDNTHFPEMEAKRIYYIQPMAYHHHLSKSDITDRLTSLNIPSLPNIYDKLITFPHEILTKYEDYFKLKKEIDDTVARKIMYHIKDFFRLVSVRRRTKKYHHFSRKFTRKFRG